MIKFLKNTSAEIIAAVMKLSGEEAHAVSVLKDPSIDEILSIWRIVTGNGDRDATEFVWGKAGNQWAEKALADCY
jgi:hypothetical protein